MQTKYDTLILQQKSKYDTLISVAFFIFFPRLLPRPVVWAHVYTMYTDLTNSKSFKSAHYNAQEVHLIIKAPKKALLSIQSQAGSSKPIYVNKDNHESTNLCYRSRGQSWGGQSWHSPTWLSQQRQSSVVSRRENPVMGIKNFLKTFLKIIVLKLFMSSVDVYSDTATG